MYAPLRVVTRELLALSVFEVTQDKTLRVGTIKTPAFERFLKEARRKLKDD